MASTCVESLVLLLRASRECSPRRQPAALACALFVVSCRLIRGRLRFSRAPTRLAGRLRRLEALEYLIRRELVASHHQVGARPQGRNPCEFRELIAQDARGMRLHLADDAVWRERWWRACRDIHPVGQNNHQQWQKLHLARTLLDQRAQSLGDIACQARFGAHRPPDKVIRDHPRLITVLWNIVYIHVTHLHIFIAYSTSMSRGAATNFVDSHKRSTQLIL